MVHDDAEAARRRAEGAPVSGFWQDLERAAEAGLPPVERWDPPYCGDIDMHIERDGTWRYMGTPIGRPKMVRLFSRALRRETDGQYVLVTPVEKLGITVADVPFVAVEMEVKGSGTGQVLGFRTNVDDFVRLDPDHPLRVEINPVTQEPAPYIVVRGAIEALIARAVFYDLVELCVEAVVEDRNFFGVWSAGTFFPVGPAESS